MLILSECGCFITDFLLAAWGEAQLSGVSRGGSWRPCPWRAHGLGVLHLKIKVSQVDMSPVP